MKTVLASRTIDIPDGGKFFTRCTFAVVASSNFWPHTNVQHILINIQLR